MMVNNYGFPDKVKPELMVVLLEIYILFSMCADHEFFERDGDDIYCEMPITFAQAALGDEIEVPTLHGKVKLKVPAGTQTGTNFRLKGKGIPNVQRLWCRDQHIIVSDDYSY